MNKEDNAIYRYVSCSLFLMQFQYSTFDISGRSFKRKLIKHSTITIESPYLNNLINNNAECWMQNRTRDVRTHLFFVGKLFQWGCAANFFNSKYQLNYWGKEIAKNNKYLQQYTIFCIFELL